MYWVALCATNNPGNSQKLVIFISIFFLYQSRTGGKLNWNKRTEGSFFQLTQFVCTTRSCDPSDIWHRFVTKLHTWNISRQPHSPDRRDNAVQGSRLIRPQYRSVGITVVYSVRGRGETRPRHKHRGETKLGTHYRLERSCEWINKNKIFLCRQLFCFFIFYLSILPCRI